MLTKQDLNEIAQIVAKAVTPLKEGILRNEKAILRNEKRMIKMQKDMNLIINYFDKSFLELQARVQRLEEKVGLGPLAV